MPFNAAGSLLLSSELPDPAPATGAGGRQQSDGEEEYRQPATASSDRLMNVFAVLRRIRSAVRMRWT